MFFKILSVLLILGAVGNGIPLEGPTEDMSRFFTQRIVGGEVAPEGFAPHMAALVSGQQYISLVCGGSIVATNKILTAAHCIDIFIIWGQLAPSFHAVVGSNRWNRGTHVYFKGFHIHPEWDWATIKNDIGFLTLEQHLEPSDSVGVIGLNFDRVTVEESYVTGWGRLSAWDNIPELLQVLKVSTMTHEQCVKDIEAATGGLGNTPHIDSNIEICTLHSYGHGVCNGDSGSALVSMKTNTQIGIVSWGFPCALGVPDVFVRISGFREFILDELSRDN